MSKLKPHEIFVAGLAFCSNVVFHYLDGSLSMLNYIELNEGEIKNRFFRDIGIEWPDDVSVVDCWKKVADND